MLEPETKRQLREEEMFREEVRRELEQQRVKKSELWEFVNSSFGIWLLSTIVVGAATLGYTKWQEKKEHEQAFSQALGMSKTEIGYRIAYFSHLVETKVGPSLSYQDALAILEGAPDRAPEGYSPGYFPQFRPFQLTFLYDQLSELVGYNDQKRLDGLGKLHTALGRLQQLPPPASGLSEEWRKNFYASIREAFEGLGAATPTLPDGKSAWPVYAEYFSKSVATGKLSPNPDVAAGAQRRR